VLNPQLIAAVDRHDVAAIRTLLCRGADPNALVVSQDDRPYAIRLQVAQMQEAQTVLAKAIEWFPRRVVKSTRFDALNRQLIVALMRNETAKTLSLIGEGADPNTRYVPPPANRLLTEPGCPRFYVNSMAFTMLSDDWAQQVHPSSLPLMIATSQVPFAE